MSGLLFFVPGLQSNIENELMWISSSGEFESIENSGSGIWRWY